MSDSHYNNDAIDEARSRRRSSTQTWSDTAANDSDSGFSDYEVIARDELRGPTNEHPAAERVESYTFPGTWSRATEDTSAALKEVGSATKQFAGAIVSSGIGKASWSVTKALAGTANRGAAATASFALYAAGADQTKLPGMFRRWLGTDKAEAAKRKKEKVRQGVETTAPSRGTSIASRQSRGRISDPYEEAVVISCGGVFHSRRTSYADEYSVASASQPPNPAMSSPLPPARESPYGTAGEEAYFDVPPMAYGGASSRPAAAGPCPLAMEESGVEEELDLREEGEDEEEYDFGGVEGTFAEE